MPFRFNMQKILDYREQREEEAKVQLAVAQRRFEETRQRLAALQTELEEGEINLRESVFKEAAERWLREVYVKGLRGDIAAAAVQMRMQMQLVEEARKLTAACAIDKKIMEKLKWRKKQRYIHDEKMKEQHANDEAATLRYKAPSF
jgi:flagellar FliJ protein